MTDITADDRQAPTSERPRPHRLARRNSARRYLVGFPAAGVAVGLIVAGTISASAALASGASGGSGASGRSGGSGSSGASASRVITLNSQASSRAGQLTVKFSYELGKRGVIKPVSLTYSGGSHLRFAHPALVFLLRPVPGPFGAKGKPVQVKSRRRPSPVIIRIRDVHHFSGTLPAKDLPKIDWQAPKGSRRVPHVPSSLLEIILASVTKHPAGITTQPGLQVGVLLGPVG